MTGGEDDVILTSQKVLMARRHAHVFSPSIVSCNPRKLTAQRPSIHNVFNFYIEWFASDYWTPLVRQAVTRALILQL